MTHAKIIREMQQSDQVVHVIRERQADDLVKERLVRRVTIQPTPVKGRAAVNLTALGKAYGTQPTPDRQQDSNS